MALFGKTKKDKDKINKKEENLITPKTTKVDAEKKAVKPVVASMQIQGDLSWVLSVPRMSEKAMYSADKNVYVFNINRRANKQLVKEALQLIYKITPIKINISKIARKKVRNQRTGVVGVKGGGKKAYVYLKKGDKINVV